MSLLVPLGLLGLLGLVALIVIYLLKPNYQQKVVSSTFVWKLSLKYKKKRIPISRLRNLLILLCQILFICCAAMILAQPGIIHSTAATYGEKIIVIDASADMLSMYDGQTRFQRAIDGAREEAASVLNDSGYVSVIIADDEADVRILRADRAALDSVYEFFDKAECSYGAADIEGAMHLAEGLLSGNPDAEVVLYTGTHYINEGENVTVKYVSDDNEWNAAILSAKAELVDNFFEFTVEVACYGNSDRALDISCVISDYNNQNTDVSLPAVRVETRNGETMTVKYSVKTDDMAGYNVTNVHLDEGVYSFERMFVSLGEQDSIAFDNEYYIYGAVRPDIKIYYHTKSDNPFYTGFIAALEEDRDLKSVWNIKVDERKSGEILNEGYDFYIYESASPDVMPTDGVVFLANPDSAGDAGFSLGSVKTIPDYEGDGATLAPGVEHEITKYVDANLFRVTQYTQVDEASLDGYDVLMYYEGNPVFFVRNDVASKIGVVTFGTKHSTFNVTFLFPLLMRCLFDYYFPGTFSGNAFDVNSDIQFTPRGTELNVRYGSENVTLEQFGDENKWLAHVSAPGTYTVTQTLISGLPLTENFYVTAPASESNVKKVEDILVNPHVERLNDFTFEDLLIYFAAALVALLFLERLLQLQEGI